MPLKHEVKQGECLSTIARRYGFLNYRIIYDHADNKEFREKRPNPNIIFPGDVLVIPDKKENARSADTGRRHDYRIPRPKRVLRLRFLDAEGHPVRTAPVVLEIEGKDVIRDKSTDGDGRFEHPLDVSDERAVITIADRRLALDFNHLNPAKDAQDDGISGIQARLLNLGYYNGELTGELDTPTRIAISIFQHDLELEATGNLDQDTIDRLIEVYGC